MNFFTVLNTLKAGKRKNLNIKLVKLSIWPLLFAKNNLSLKPINYFKFFDK